MKDTNSAATSVILKKIFVVVCAFAVFIVFILGYFARYHIINASVIFSKAFHIQYDTFFLNAPYEKKCFRLILEKLDLDKMISKGMKPYFTELKTPFNYETLPHACFLMFYDNQNDTNLHPKCFRRHYSHQFIRQNVTMPLKIIKEAFESNNLELILDSGSAVGSWRFHGLVPYDHDVDFRFNVKLKPKVKRLLQNISNHLESYHMLYRDTESTNQHWKIYTNCKTKSYSSCTFQIDFFFDWVSSEGVKIQESPHYYPYKVVYPLVQRPFEGILFWTFNDMPRMIEISYPGTGHICDSSHDWSIADCSQNKVSCRKLQFKYPYVKRTTLKYSNLKVMVEVLVNKTTISSVFITPDV